MLKSVVWFITWACQNHCPYCWERQRQTRGEFTPEKFQDPGLWIEAWNRIAQKNGIGFVMDISGGEPFIQPGFVDMLAGFNDDIRIAITTNLKENIVPFVQKVGTDKVFSITASYHPSEMSIERFIGKVLLLKNKGFRVVVNFVTWPEQMYLLPRVKKAVEDEDIIFHVDPYAQTPYMPYELDDQEKAFLKRYIGQDREQIINQKPVTCSAGMNHLTVMPDGKAYRCLNDTIAGRNPIGNIFQKDFEFNRTHTFCDEHHKCAGCNRDKVTVDYVNV